MGEATEVVSLARREKGGMKDGWLGRGTMGEWMNERMADGWVNGWANSHSSLLRLG